MHALCFGGHVFFRVRRPKGDNSTFLEEFSGGNSFDLRYKGDAELSGTSRRTIMVVERRKVNDLKSSFPRFRSQVQVQSMGDFDVTESPENKISTPA